MMMELCGQWGGEREERRGGTEGVRKGGAREEGWKKEREGEETKKGTGRREKREDVSMKNSTFILPNLNTSRPSKIWVFLFLKTSKNCDMFQEF